jgi:hypothetical protein
MAGRGSSWPSRWWLGSPPRPPGPASALRRIRNCSDGGAHRDDNPPAQQWHVVTGSERSQLCEGLPKTGARDSNRAGFLKQRVHRRRVPLVRAPDLGSLGATRDVRTREVLRDACRVLEVAVTGELLESLEIALHSRLKPAREPLDPSEEQTARPAQERTSCRLERSDSLEKCRSSPLCVLDVPQTLQQSTMGERLAVDVELERSAMGSCDRVRLFDGLDGT